MGPCTLVDLVGIDVHVHASEALYEKLREPRMAPPPRLVAMRNAGLLGPQERPRVLQLLASQGRIRSRGALRGPPAAGDPEGVPLRGRAAALFASSRSGVLPGALLTLL